MFLSCKEDMYKKDNISKYQYKDIICKSYVCVCMYAMAIFGN